MEAVLLDDAAQMEPMAYNQTYWKKRLKELCTFISAQFLIFVVLYAQTTTVLRNYR